MVDGKKLKKIVIKILKKRGLSLSHATTSADALINAEYVGAYGHGVSRLKMYCERIKKKVINPKPKIKIRKIIIVFSNFFKINPKEIIIIART